MSDLTDPSKISIQSRRVAPLPIGSGGDDTTKTALNTMNTQLTMMNVQAATDTKYDPPVPKHLQPPQITPFCSGPGTSAVEMIGVVGLLLIVYGVMAK